MTDAELRAELAALFGLSVAVLERGAELYREATRRGLAVVIRSVTMRDFLPRVAGGTLSARAVVRFCDLRKLLRAVGGLAVGEQERLAAGGTVEVLVNGEVLPLTARELWPCWVRQAFQVPGRVATVEEQSRYAEAVRAAAEARRRRQAARLVRRLEAEGVSTAARAVEAIVAAGWGPTGRPLGES